MMRSAPPARAAAYLAVSLAALALDSAIYLALIGGGIAPVVAAALGYGAGIAAHWWGSSRRVFADSLAPAGPARRRQQALFVGSALAGLGITMAVVALATRLGCDARLAKPIAVVASFGATWLMRRRLVFAPRAAVAG